MTPISGSTVSTYVYTVVVGVWRHPRQLHDQQRDQSFCLHSTSLFENTRIQGDSISQPSGALSMVALILRLHRIGMKQSTQRATIDNQPGNKGTELCGCEEVHLEHGHRMRANRSVPETVDPQLGNCRE